MKSKDEENIQIFDSGAKREKKDVKGIPMGYIDIEPETLGQYIGIKDNNGKKIFEGDIVRYFGFENGFSYGQIKWGGENNPTFDIYLNDDSDSLVTLIQYLNPRMEVIGNIYDNPELLEV